MLWQQTQGPNGFAGGDSNVSIGTYAMNEVGLRVARNGYTKTLTASTFARGMPVQLGISTSTTTPPAVGAVWPNGFDVILNAGSGSGTAVVNNLTIGLAYDYPDTSLARTGTWQPEDVGLVQAYGLNTKAIVSVGTVSMAAGLVLVPDSGGVGIGAQLVTAVGAVSAAATGTAAHAEIAGLGALFVLAGTVASSSGSGTVAAKVFVRCL